MTVMFHITTHKEIQVYVDNMQARFMADEDHLATHKDLWTTEEVWT